MDKKIIVLQLCSKDIYIKTDREEIIDIVYSLVEANFHIEEDNLYTLLLILNNSVNIKIESHSYHFERYIEIVKLILQ